MVSPNARLKIKEARPIDRFRNQGTLLEKFGEEGISFYEAAEGSSVAAVAKKISMPIQRALEIADYMESAGMLVAQEGAAAPPKIPSSPSQYAKPPAAPRKGAPMPPADDEERGKVEEGEMGTTDDNADSESEEEGRQGAVPKIKPQAEFGNEAREEAGEVVPAGLSSLEKLIYEKYGPVGLKVYSLIDGEKTAGEILSETHISEVKLVEILEFMDEHGIIKLENHEEKKQAVEQPAESPVVEKFKPILEDAADQAPSPPQAAKKEEVKRPPRPPVDVEELIDIIPIDVPAMAQLSLAHKAELAATLPIKFGKAGMDMFNLIDGKRDFVEIAMMLHTSLFDIDDILGYFGKKNFVTFSQLPREEVRKRYGEDGFAIYKKYGRDGVYLYELIGKEKSLKDIVLLSKIEPKRAVEIFVFIHQVLGLDVPFDKEMVYKQLGIR